MTLCSGRTDLCLSGASFDRRRNFYLKFPRACYTIPLACRCVGMVDEADSKSVASDGVWVRVPPPAPKKSGGQSLPLFFGINMGTRTGAGVNGAPGAPQSSDLACAAAQVESHHRHHVRRTQLRSVSAVCARAAKTSHPLRPSSFPISYPLRWASIWIPVRI